MLEFSVSIIRMIVYVHLATLCTAFIGLCMIFVFAVRDEVERIKSRRGNNGNKR